MAYYILFSIYSATLFAGIVIVYLFSTKQRPAFPVVNEYPRDFFRRKAYCEYNKNSRKLISDGLKKHNGPIAFLVPNGFKIVLPSSLTDWVKSNRDLDHQELVRQDYFANFAGFESQAVTHAPDRILIDVIRAKLSQNNKTVSAVNGALEEAFQQLWGDDKNWKRIDWEVATGGIISQAAAPAFVGPEMAKNPEWHELVQGYVHAFFSAAGELHQYPAWSRFIVQWVLPGPAKCREYVRRARIVVNEIISKRDEDREKAESEGSHVLEHHDAIAWTTAASGGKGEAGDYQLALAVAALFTTAEVLRQILINIAQHPELVEPLRSEMKQQISKHGTTVAALFNMTLLDSVMKESQRNIHSLVGLERIALRDTFLPDGTKIRQGDRVVVDAGDMWNPAVHSDPEVFDAYRFLNRRKAGDTSSQFVQSSKDHNVFGGGKHTCPGRFFANNELKLILAHILLKYDIQLAKGYVPKQIQSGFYAMVDSNVRFEVRRVYGIGGEGLK